MDTIANYRALKDKRKREAESKRQSAREEKYLP